MCIRDRSPDRIKMDRMLRFVTCAGGSCRPCAVEPVFMSIYQDETIEHTAWYRWMVLGGAMLATLANLLATLINPVNYNYERQYHDCQYDLCINRIEVTSWPYLAAWAAASTLLVLGYMGRPLVSGLSTPVFNRLHFVCWLLVIAAVPIIVLVEYQDDLDPNLSFATTLSVLALIMAQQFNGFCFARQLVFVATVFPAQFSAIFWMSTVHDNLLGAFWPLFCVSLVAFIHCTAVYSSEHSHRRLFLSQLKLMQLNLITSESLAQAQSETFSASNLKVRHSAMEGRGTGAGAYPVTALL
eukprot:TRINITY_DN12045_c0_g1_i6.p2 TRINITY_DN12045_c0_g1~~TRINITY_DN12045_c0_g1_i6.p2  ORF type:complete len:298 (-),score=53.81 TRINITY_DN12045_c0_g1_i6:1135-2028(-)